MKKNWRVSILFSITSTSLLFSSSVLKAADEGFIPSVYHFQIRDRMKECSIQKSVFTKQNDTLAKKEESMVGIRELTRKQYVDLRACGKSHGITNDLAPVEDIALIKDCEPLFEAWLGSGSNIMMTENEIKEIQSNLELLKNYMRYHCTDGIVALK